MPGPGSPCRALLLLCSALGAAGQNSGLHLTMANPKIVFGPNSECTLQMVDGALQSDCPINAPPPPSSGPAAAAATSTGLDVASTAGFRTRFQMSSAVVKNFAISFWVKFDDAGANFPRSLAFSPSSSGVNQLGIAISHTSPGSGEGYLMVCQTTNACKQNTGGFTMNAWNFVTVSYDHSASTLYLGIGGTVTSYSMTMDAYPSNQMAFGADSFTINTVNSYGPNTYAGIRILAPGDNALPFTSNFDVPTTAYTDADDALSGLTGCILTSSATGATTGCVMNSLLLAKTDGTKLYDEALGENVGIHGGGPTHHSE